MFFKCLDFHMSTPYSLSKNNNLSQLHIGSACLTLLYLEIRLAQCPKSQTAIMAWVKHIVNHFWYCCKQAKTEERFKVFWEDM